MEGQYHFKEGDYYYIVYAAMDVVVLLVTMMCI